MSQGARRSIRRHITIGAALALLGLAAPAVASAADRYVAPSGSDAGNHCLAQASPCRTIQHAIDVSDTVNFDAIRLAAGTYVESATSDRVVVIIGPNHGVPGYDPDREAADEAVLVGVGTAPALTMQAPTGLWGVTVGPSTSASAGSVGVAAAPGVTLSSLQFDVFRNLDNGVVSRGGGAHIDHNLFEGSDRSDSAAILGLGDDGTTITDNVFSANTTGVAFEGSANAVLSDNLFSDVTSAGVTIDGGDGVDLEFNDISGAGDGIVARTATTSGMTNGTITGNNLHDLGGHGLRVQDGSLAAALSATGNRFFATALTGLQVEGDAVVDATDNWWGCNEGPDQPGCDDTGGTGTMDVDPWTVMTLTADPTSIAIGGSTSIVTASFRTDSNGDPIANNGIGNALVDFSTSLGSLDSSAEETFKNSQADVELTSGLTSGTATVTATLDSESLTTDVTIGDGPVAKVAPVNENNEYDFGKVTSGSHSPQQKFTVKNVGAADLTVSSVLMGGLDESMFVVTHDGCTGQTMAPGAFCSFKVYFRPTGLAGGGRAATLEIDTNAAQSATQIALFGQIGARVELKPVSVDFGSVTAGLRTPLQKFVMKNVGTSFMTVDAVSIAGVDAGQFEIGEDGCTGAAVGPGSTCTVRVRFRPTSAGVKAATLQVDSVDLITPATSALSGTGAVAPTALTVTPGAHDFGAVAVGTQSPNQKWTVKNTGGSTVHVGGAALSGGDADQFQRNATTCDDVDLAPGEFCTVKVRFRPTGTPGPRATQLVVTSDVPGSIAADLSGTAVGV